MELSLSLLPIHTRGHPRQHIREIREEAGRILTPAKLLLAFEQHEVLFSHVHVGRSNLQTGLQDRNQIGR